MNDTTLAEASLLGGILAQGDLYAYAADVVRAEYFQDSRHAAIYQAISDLIGQGKAISPHSVAALLKQRGKGGAIPESYLMEISLNESYAHAKQIITLSRLLAEQGVKNSLYSLSVELQEGATSTMSDPFALLDLTQDRLLNIAGKLQTSKPRLASELIHETMETIDALQNRKVGCLGTPTGFKSLDHVIGGLVAPNLYVVAGRPSQGKSALCLNLAENIARDDWTGIFSIEMGKQDLMLRTMSRVSGLNYNLIRSGSLNQADHKRLIEAADTVHQMKLIIDDTPRLNLTSLMAKTKQLVMKHDLAGIFVDYIQLMEPPDRKANRDEQVGAVTRGLKALAKDLNIWVVAVSSMNRAVEGRADRRPTLADLRESGSIEYDADVVMFVHRPWMYGEREKDGLSTENLAYIILGKQRNGPLEDIEMEFIGKTTTFKDVGRYALPQEYRPKVPSFMDEKEEEDSELF